MSDITLRRPIYFGYWLIGAAFVAQFVSAGMQNYVVGPFLTPMTFDLGWSRAEYTLPRTIAQFVTAGIGFIVGSYVDRFGARRFVLAGGVVLAGALYMTAWVTTLWHWVFLNGVVLAAGAALVGNLVVNVTLAKWFVNWRGRAIAFAAMGVSAAGILLTPLVTVLIDDLGWRAAWRILGIATLVMIVPVALLMRRAPEAYGLEPDGGAANEAAALRVSDDFTRSLTRGEALRTSTFYWLVMAFGLFTITIQVMLLQTIPLMTDAGYSRATGALMIVVTSVPAMFSKPVWGWLIDGVEGPPLAAVSAGLTAVSLFVIVYSVDAGMLWLSYVGFAVLGFGWGGMIPLQEVIWASFFGRRYLGAVRSAAMPFALIFAAGAPVATSWYFDVVGNYDGAILTIAAMNLFSAGMLLLIPGRTLR